MAVRTQAEAGCVKVGVAVLGLMVSVDVKQHCTSADDVVVSPDGRPSGDPGSWLLDCSR